jgi:hypothetical protein
MIHEVTDNDTWKVRNKKTYIHVRHASFDKWLQEERRKSFFVSEGRGVENHPAQPVREEEEEDAKASLGLPEDAALRAGLEAYRAFGGCMLCEVAVTEGISTRPCNAGAAIEGRIDAGGRIRLGVGADTSKSICPAGMAMDGAGAWMWVRGTIEGKGNPV